MLTLTVKDQERIYINGNEIVITLHDIHRNQARLTIVAEKDKYQIEREKPHTKRVVKNLEREILSLKSKPPCESSPF